MIVDIHGAIWEILAERESRWGILKYEYLLKLISEPSRLRQLGTEPKWLPIFSEDKIYCPD